MRMHYSGGGFILPQPVFRPRNRYEMKQNGHLRLLPRRILTRPNPAATKYLCGSHQAGAARNNTRLASGPAGCLPQVWENFCRGAGPPGPNECFQLERRFARRARRPVQKYEKRDATGWNAYQVLGNRQLTSIIDGIMQNWEPAVLHVF